MTDVFEEATGGVASGMLIEEHPAGSRTERSAQNAGKRVHRIWVIDKLCKCDVLFPQEFPDLLKNIADSYSDATRRYL